MQKIIKNRLPECTTVDLDSLLSLQGTLKKVEQKIVLKLRNSLEHLGIIFPLFVWYEEKTKKNWLIDGVHRVRCLKELRDSGYEIDPIPVILIQVKNRIEAKKMILQASAEYSKIVKDGFNSFTKDICLDNYIDELNFTDIKLNIKPPNEENVEDDKVVQFIYTRDELNTLQSNLSILRDRYQLEKDTDIIVRALEEHIKTGA